MKSRTLSGSLSLVAIGAIFGIILVASFGGNFMKMGFAGDGTVPRLGGAAPNVPNIATLEAQNQAYIALSKAITPTVVSIIVTTEEKPAKKNDNNGFRFFFGPDGKDEENPFHQFMPEPGPQVGSGSGVIISDNGYIITNNHVVEDASEDGIVVKLSDKREFKAKLVGRDPLTDIAVVRIEGTNLPVVAFGNSDDAQVGELVFAVGNPLGLNYTLTSGIVSAIGRGNLGLNRERNTTKNYGVEDFIQTDAAINPGNSGGGLFNVKGMLIGINSAIATSTGRYEGYGFAVPINLAKFVAEDLIRFGKVNRGYIGVTIAPVDQKTAKAMGLESAHGVLVQDVSENGAGKEAGLEGGDIILTIDGREVREPNELQNFVAQHHAGDVVKLEIWREGSKITKSVKLKARNEKDIADNTDEEKDEPKKDAEREKTSTATFDNIGLTVKALDTKAKEDFDVKGGVMVTKVKTLSEASNRGLFPNDVIVEVWLKSGKERKKVKSVSDLKNILTDLSAGDVVNFRVKRKQGSEVVPSFVVIEIPKS